MSDAANRKVQPHQPVFTTAIAADMLGIHPRVLRIYEDAGIIKAARTASNRRQYSQNDLRVVALAMRLTQECGINLAGVRIILTLVEELRAEGVDADAALERVLSLSEQPPDVQ